MAIMMQNQHQLFVMFILLQLQLLHFQDYSSSFCMGTTLHRPNPSHDISSLIHLQEIPGSKYDPRSINNAKLKIKLGRQFDPEYMSIYQPEDMNSTSTSLKSSMSTSNSNSSNKRNFKKLKGKNSNSKSKSSNNNNDAGGNNINNVIGTSNLLDYSSIPEKFHGRLRFKFIRKLEKFLQVYTSCPLLYKWRDLGVRFWPRYLREGHCQGQFNGSGDDDDRVGGGGNNIRSCSIPPGLYCQPSQQVYKVLLRWHCQNWEHRKRCRWLEIRHPIITGCSCGTCVGGMGN